MTLNDRRMHDKIDGSDAQDRNHAHQQHLLLEKLHDRLDQIDNHIHSQAVATSDLVRRFEWLRTLGQDIKNMMQGIFMMTLATYKVVGLVKSRLLSHLERSLFQEPLILEDSLGRIFPIGLQFINSWDAFDAMIHLRFRNQWGYEMVSQKKYVLH